MQELRKGDEIDACLDPLLFETIALLRRCELFRKNRNKSSWILTFTLRILPKGQRSYPFPSAKKHETQRRGSNTSFECAFESYLTYQAVLSHRFAHRCSHRKKEPSSSRECAFGGDFERKGARAFRCLSNPASFDFHFYPSLAYESYRMLPFRHHISNRKKPLSFSRKGRVPFVDPVSSRELRSFHVRNIFDGRDRTRVGYVSIETVHAAYTKTISSRSGWIETFCSRARHLIIALRIRSLRS